MEKNGELCWRFFEASSWPFTSAFVPFVGFTGRTMTKAEDTALDMKSLPKEMSGASSGYLRAMAESQKHLPTTTIN